MELQLGLSFATLLAIGGLFLYVRDRVKARAGEEGKIDAQLERLDDIKATLAATTATVEEIKSDVGHMDWLRRERMTLMRQKLEEVIAAAFETEYEMERYRSTYMAVTLEDNVNRPLNRMYALCACYFPDLIDQRDRVGLAAAEHRKVLNVIRPAFLRWRMYADNKDYERAAKYQELYVKVNEEQDAEVNRSYEGFRNAVNVFANGASAMMNRFVPKAEDNG